ncbi:MFS transporter [Uliginosibacterium sp. H3]|uniref:MFS transporter n=1 Tax=Uliginosibacterium silvisoli TaxID=3114758 RepID=A0ABU6K0B4_9RHOO|nr:MFS transporter [Uliginosibacterium sp. H3]
MTTDNKSPSGLLFAPRFGPIFLTQFLGAFNDNVFKNALSLMVAFHSGKVLGLEPAIVVPLIGGIFILPFFLFSAMAGQVADKYDKARVIRIIKFIEIGIAATAAAGFATSHIELLLAAVFLMGLHSTFFGPLKYSILPQHLHANELVAGNAWVESGTFVSILVGSIAAGVLISIKPEGPMLAGVTCIVVAIAGYVSSRFIPAAPPSAPGLKINLNPISETARNIRIARGNRTVFHSLMGISWFWFYGAIFLTQFPSFVHLTLGGDEQLATALLATFIVGIALGSFLCERLSGKHVEIGLVPLGSIGLTLFGIDLWLASPAVPPQALGVGAFFSDLHHWRLIFDLVMIGVSGGFYTVPLYSLIQSRSRPEERSRIIAANNILNAAFMVVSAIFAGAALASGISIPQIFLITALMNVAVAIYVYKLVPEFLMRFLAWMLMHTVYRLRTHGIENIPEEGPALLICNHVSYVDPVIIAAACRRPIRFVMDHNIYKLPVANFIFRENRAIPIAPAREDATQLDKAYDEIAAALAAGELVGIFPEGGLTRDGEIAPFKNGIAKILERTPVPVVPMALCGLWDSAFARKPGSSLLRALRRGVWSRVELNVGSARASDFADPFSLQLEVARLRGDAR